MSYCYRHPNVETAVRCSWCEKPICPDCMLPTSVGMRCPDCAKQRTQVKTLSTVTARSKTPITLSLIAICVLVFAVEFLMGGSGVSGSSGRLITEGGLAGYPVSHGEPWRLVTSGFLHAGVLHLAFNMFLLYVLGELLEPALGSARFALIGAVALISGSLGVLLISPNALTVGASGMIFGLLGAAVLTSRRIGIDPMQSGLGTTLLLNLGITFLLPGISIGGHLGGLAGGVLAAALLVEAPYHYPRVDRRLFTVGTVLLLPLFTVACLLVA